MLRSLSAAGAMATVVCIAPQFAHADAKADIAAKAKEAMQNYDNFENETARKLLNEALAIAKKAKLDKDPAVAKIHLYLGIVYLAGLNQPDSAKLAFLSATEIDNKIQIEPAYKRKDLADLLEEARSQTATPQPPDPVDPPTGAVDCATVMGLKHSLVESAPANAPLVLDAYAGEDVVAARMSIMYRVEGATDFVEAPMGKDGCKYSGNIPREAVAGKMLHYYIAGFDSQNKVVVSSGSAGAPNLVDITVGATDIENPNITERGGTVSKPKKKKVFFTIALGSGGGAIAGGNTETVEAPIDCDGAPVCVAPALLNFMPELGFFLSKQASLSLVGRFGLPVGANVEGHATLAVAGLLRARYNFGSAGTGFGIFASVGAGAIRNVVGVTNAPAGMDQDTVAIGPLLVGGGVSYSAPIGSSLRFVADLAATGGIPVVDKLGAATVNAGAQFDFSLGLAAAF